MLLGSCSTSTPTSNTIPTSSTTITQTSTTASVSTSTTTAITTVKTSQTSTTGNWWDKLGVPQYGGTMTFMMTRNATSFDSTFTGVNFSALFQERLTANDWTIDPSVYFYGFGFRPAEYVWGCLEESWDFPDPSTYVAHLRKGIYWQNIAPVNGREFTADDVVFSFGRMFGGGDGFTKPTPIMASNTQWQSLLSVEASDKYTVVFKWKISNPEVIMENISSPSNITNIVAPEAVKLWGDVNDWHHAIGTGPFILQDFVSGSALNLVKNPNYWGYDGRYPQNRLPYADTLKVLIIPDHATTLAAVRTGKIDVVDGMSFIEAQGMSKTNPQIVQVTVPASYAATVEMRNDTKPFNDVRVRKAMQMAIDLPTIAKTYYGNVTPPYPSTLTTNLMTGWGFPYQQWPQDLKDEYAYNPTAAKKLLADAGFPTGFKTNIAANNTADLDLLQIVKSYFTDIGIDMEIRPMDQTSWLAFVQNGKKYDQLAYPAAGSLGKGTEPSLQLNYFHTGDATNFPMVSDPVFDGFYNEVLVANNIDGVKQALRDANEYVARQHFTISLLQPNLFAFSQPWLKGYNGQYSSVSTGSGGPLYPGFYAARFWIDSNLKKNMGY
jgi:peptide/nickel transport system substrate-binding protein